MAATSDIAVAASGVCVATTDLASAAAKTTVPAGNSATAVSEGAVAARQSAAVTTEIAAAARKAATAATFPCRWWLPRTVDRQFLMQREVKGRRAADSRKRLCCGEERRSQRSRCGEGGCVIEGG